MRARKRSESLAGIVMLAAILLTTSAGMGVMAQDNGPGLGRETLAYHADGVTVVLAGAPPEGYSGGPIELTRDSLSEEQRAEIQASIERNIRMLEAQGRLAPKSPQAVSLGWPLRNSGRGSTAAANDSYAVSGYVDHDPGYPDKLLDWACGTRTYDLADGYNHRGTDYSTWPFSWLSMDEDALQVVAAAPGTIVDKKDGNYDRNCGLGSAPWNAIYVRHADGSVAWYGHLKKHSLTSKAVGNTVAAGEYLGIVGSSGSSTGPHLHFELWDGAKKLVDPYHGDCNSAPTWWASQRPYKDSAVNMVMTGTATPETPACPNPEVPHIKDSFAPGENVYFTIFFRDFLPGQKSVQTVYRPDGTVYSRWSKDGPGSWWPGYRTSWWLPFNAELPAGTWRFEVEFEGQTYRTYFNFKDPTLLNVQAPTGGSSWARGKTHNILWTDNLGGNVRIDLYKGGAYHSTIAPSTASDGSQAWPVPQGLGLGGDYRVRVINLANPALFAQSDTFGIVGTGPAQAAAYLPLAARNYAAGWRTITRLDFEGSFPGAWTTGDNQPGAGVYYWSKRNCRAYGGSFSGWPVGGGSDGAGLSCGSHYPNNASSYMVYGPFSLADATEAEMRYRLWLNSGMDKLMALASVDGDAFYGNSTAGSSRGWVEKVLDLGDVYTLGDLRGQPRVWVLFAFVSDGSGTLPEGAYVDDIVVRRRVTGPTAAGPRSIRRPPVVHTPGLMEAPADMVLGR